VTSYLSDVSPRIMIGESAGFTLRYDGFDRRFAGKYVRAALIAACTSRSAPSMLRLSSNCSATFVLLSELDDVISVTPAMWLNCRSSGVATEAAMISALAPGSDAFTLMVGKSTCGSGDTGSTLNAIAPAMATPTVSSVVATGRRMNGDDRLMPVPLPPVAAHSAAPCAKASGP